MAFQDTLSTLANIAPVHLFSYSAVLGMSVYQSFTVVKTVHRTLPRPAFVALQGRLFPVYFRLQTFYLLLAAATLPPYGPISLLRDATSAVLFSLAGMGALLNLFVYGPRTRQAMLDRHRKVAADVPDGGEAEGASGEVVQGLNKAFRRSHAMSLHLNLVTIAALVGYGWKLALRVKLE